MASSEASDDRYDINLIKSVNSLICIYIDVSRNVSWTNLQNFKDKDKWRVIDMHRHFINIFQPIFQVFTVLFKNLLFLLKLS